MIGIFDSGISGLQVAAEIERRCPHLPLVYANDTARAPLSTKSFATIADTTRRGLQFLADQGATLFVVAGGSAACAVEQGLAGPTPQPLLTPLAATVERALAVSPSGRIGLIGGPAVVAAGCHDRLLRQRMPSARLFAASCPLLEALVDSGWANKRETKMILRRYLHPLREHQVDTLILASGHHALLAHLIQPRIGRRVKLVDSSLALAEEVLARIADSPTADTGLPAGRHGRYFVSDRSATFAKMAARLLARPVEILPW